MSKINHYEKIRGKKILVTGGMGFIGQNLVKCLLNDYQCEVIVVDDLSNSHKISFGDYDNRASFHNISVLDSKKFLPLLSRVNFIFHLACKQISASGTDPFGHLSVNGQSTLEILEYLRYNDLPLFERFIYTSSCSVYGSSTHLPTNENHPVHILSNYAATKLLGENLSLVYNKNYDIPVSVIRYSNVYGYGQSPMNPYCGVLGKFVHNALTQKPLEIFGDGEQTRDYTFVTDAVDATILSAVHPLAYGDVFNVGTSVETSVNKLASIIAQIVPGTKINYTPERDIDNVRRRAIDIEKIHQKLSWSPKISVNSGIASAIHWYKHELGL
jgi:UDP-glucose 4-epimerase